MPIHFEDRQAKYPNRWTMKKSDGTSEVITLVRNDEPIYDGTPMNAETLNSLSDVAGADLARAQAEAARTKAQNAAASAAISETNVKASESATQKSAEEAAASAEEAAASAALAGTRAGTDKTLSVEDAPADAKEVGDALAAMYTKKEIQKLIEDSLAAYREKEYAKIKFWVSNDPTSPAELFGGTWEQIKDRFIMAAGDTYAAGSVGGKASVALEARNIPRLWGQSLAYDVSGPNFHVGQWGWAASARQISSQNGFDAYDGLYVTVGYDNNSAVDVMPPYVAKYVWQRIE